MQLPKPIYAHEQVYLKKYKMTKEIKVYKCQKSTSLIVIRQTSQDNQLLTIPLKSYINLDRDMLVFQAGGLLAWWPSSRPDLPERKHAVTQP